MNRVEVSTEGLIEPAWLDSFIQFCDRLLMVRGREDWEVSCLLCDEATIRELNATYRNIDAPTDVLSFQLGERDEAGMWIAGDIVICLPMVIQNARDFGVSQEEELKRVTIHAILHLEGFDHETNAQNEPMLVLQEDILKMLKGERIF